MGSSTIILSSYRQTLRPVLHDWRHGIVRHLPRWGGAMRPRVSAVVALVLGLGALPILVPSALAEPVLHTDQRSSTVLTATEPQQAVQLKSQQTAFASATLRVQATRSEPVAFTGLAAPLQEPKAGHFGRGVAAPFALVAAAEVGLVGFDLPAQRRTPFTLPGQVVADDMIHPFSAMSVNTGLGPLMKFRP